MALTSSRSLDIASDDWRANSACRDTDPDLFFPVGTTGPAIDQIEAAKAVCRECDAKAPCLDFALTSSCYDPGPGGSPCGACDACLLRIKGFQEAGILDSGPKY